MRRATIREIAPHEAEAWLAGRLKFPPASHRVTWLSTIAATLAAIALAETVAAVWLLAGIGDGVIR